MVRSHDPSERVRVIDDLETLRLLTQSLRLRIVEALRAAPDPLAVKDLAEILSTSQTKLYYHVKLLEEAGLIRIAATRLVSGITEKRYEAATYRLSVDRALLSPGTSGDEGLDVFLSVILGQVQTEIRRSVAAGLIDLDLAIQDQVGTNQLTIGRKWLWLTPADVSAFGAGLENLWNQFLGSNQEPDAALAALATRQPGAELYELLIGFYPTVGSADAALPDDAAETSSGEPGR